MADERPVIREDLRDIFDALKELRRDVSTVKDAQAQMRLDLEKSFGSRDVSSAKYTTKFTVQQGILWGVAGLIGSALITSLIAWFIKHLP